MPAVFACCFARATLGGVRLEADRAIKEPAEIERIRAACAVADRALASIVRRIKPGVTERELALALEWEMRTGGAEESMPLVETYARVERLLASLRQAAAGGKVRLDESLRDKDTVALVNEALAHLRSYHRQPALTRRGDRL